VLDIRYTDVLEQTHIPQTQAVNTGNRTTLSYQVKLEITYRQNGENKSAYKQKRLTGSWEKHPTYLSKINHSYTKR
jgi:hypothetical protein